MIFFDSYNKGFSQMRGPFSYWIEGSVQGGCLIQ
ncbi:hypothetical protein BBOR36S_05178 [Brevibacillus borstelensis]